MKIYIRLITISILVCAIALFHSCESVLDETQSISNLDFNIEEGIEYSLNYYDGESYSSQAVVREVERLYYKLSEAYENFGGLWHDKNDQYIIWIGMKGELISINQIRNEIQEIVSNNLESRFYDISEVNYTFIETEFSFLELSHFRDLLNPPLHEREDIVESFIDHENNSYSIGIKKGTDRSEIINIIEKYSVPKRAIYIYESEPVQLAFNNKQATPTLRDRYRPLMGGLQITRQIGGLCTFGFNVKLDNEDQWITNSHCTGSFAQTSNSDHFQNNSHSQNNLIGTEFRDFQGYTNPDGSRFRYADAALISKTIGVSSNFGKIAYTNPAWGGWGNPGNLEIGQFYTYRTITGEGTALSHSTLLHKTGRTTGTTKGLVNGLCVDVSNIADLPGWTLKCQVRTTIYIQGGDSGSPVYVADTYMPNATLYGVIWGFNEGQQVSYYSPISS